MKNASTFKQINFKIFKQVGLNLFFLFLSLPFIVGQGSPDAVPASTITSGESHATIKAQSNGYTNDTTEVKWTNMNSVGTGTEFVLRSVNETGLVLSSNSDLTNNTKDNIMTFQADGNVQIGNLAGAGSQVLSTDNSGRIIESQSNFNSFANLNTPPVDVTFTAWSPVGPSITFTKEFDHTIIEADFLGIVSYVTSSASGVRLRVQIDGATNHRYAEGAVNASTVPDFTVSKSIFKNLPAGTYTAQVHARSLGGNATEVFLGPGGLGGTIWIEERL